MRMGKVHRRIQALRDGFMVVEIEKFFTKDRSTAPPLIMANNLNSYK